jgi:hypothetical protein
VLTEPLRAGEAAGGDVVVVAADPDHAPVVDFHDEPAERLADPAEGVVGLDGASRLAPSITRRGQRGSSRRASASQPAASGSEVQAGSPASSIPLRSAATPFAFSSFRSRTSPRAIWLGG